MYGNPLSYVDPAGKYGVGGAIFGAGLNVAIQAGLNYAATGDLSRSLLCLDLADIALSAALGAAGPGLGNLIKNPAKGAVFTRRENAFLYMFMVQPASMGSKRVLNFTVDDLRRKF